MTEQNQLTVGSLKTIIKDLPDDYLIFFRRVAPIAGNIESAYHAEVSTYGSFGVALHCVIIEPYKVD
jgi:hypothetical protein